MCQDCGCDKPARPGHGRKGKFVHTHDGHTHTHAHGDAAHAAHDAAPAAAPRRIVVEQSVLARNDALAARNRQWLDEHGVVAVNLISSPGAGKTALLEKTLDRLAGEVKCAVITGDQQTDNDARRLRGRGAAVMQIQTRSACHLNAGQIAKALPRVVKPGTRLLFIENVGNLVCPAAFDLGEHFKIALLSTAEGEDKPLKYPTLFAFGG